MNILRKYKDCIDLKLLCISILLALITTTIFTYYTNQKINDDLEENIIRLHIRGRSNSQLDQNFKLYIRDMVLSYINDVNSNNSKNDTESFILNNIDNIQNYVDNLILKSGFNYKSNVTYGIETFPPKQYGFITLPKGTYNSLTINLDKGEGENWWCVVYPALCFVESDTLEFNTESVETLKEILDEETFFSITSKNGNIEMDFKLLETFENIFK